MRKAFFAALLLLGACSAAQAQGVPPLSGWKVPSDLDILVTGITAKAGGGQATATLLTGTINSVDTVATAADSVKLQLCAGGAGPPKRTTVVNTSANSLQVFGSGTDTIDGVATGTGVALAAGVMVEYTCTAVASGVGKWFHH